MVHHGASLWGSMIHSLVATDICTSWTEAVPLLAKEQSLIVEGLEAAGQRLPFRIRGIDSDNDSAFINETLIKKAQSALAAVTCPAIRPTPSGESLEQFLAKLPDLWRQDAAHTSRKRRVQPPRTWRTRPDPFARPFRRSVVRRAVLVAGRP